MLRTPVASSLAMHSGASRNGRANTLASSAHSPGRMIDIGRFATEKKIISKFCAYIAMPTRSWPSKTHASCSATQRCWSHCPLPLGVSADRVFAHQTLYRVRNSASPCCQHCGEAEDVQLVLWISPLPLGKTAYPSRLSYWQACSTTEHSPPLRSPSSVCFMQGALVFTCYLRRSCVGMNSVRSSCFLDPIIIYLYR